MQSKKHLCYLSKRVVCMTLAALMVLSTAITGCGYQEITTHALSEDSHDMAETVSDETVSLRETLSDSLDDGLAGQAAELSDEYWEDDVPSNKDAAVYEYAENEGEDVPDYETGSSVDLDSVNATTVEKNYDENGLRETAYKLKVMYTTVDAATLTTDNITDMWNNNYEAFISDYDIYQSLYEVDGYDDCYVAFVNFSALNDTEGKIISADFTKGTEFNPVDVSNEVVLDKETGVLYVPKAWYFAGDGEEVIPDLKAQIMVSVDAQDDSKTDEYGNLLANVSVTVDNEARADIVLHDGKYAVAAYDFLNLPLFAPESVKELSSDDVEFYINGSTEPVNEKDITYNPITGKFTIKTFAMTVSEVHVVLKNKTFLQSVASVFSIGNAKADNFHITYNPDGTNGEIYPGIDGMTSMYNVSNLSELRPNIDIDKLTVGDVFAYETLGNYSGAMFDVGRQMYDDGQSNFVYGATYWYGDTPDEFRHYQSQLYWLYVGNYGLEKLGDYLFGLPEYTDNSSYEWPGYKWHRNAPFIVELPFRSTDKIVPDPVLIKTSGTKLEVGQTVNFGNQENWKWIDTDNTPDPNTKSRIKYQYAVMGQCAHTINDAYMGGDIDTGNDSDDKNDEYDKFRCTCEAKFDCACTDETCEKCAEYREANGLEKCDLNCPTCSSGKCKSCRVSSGCAIYRNATGKDYCDRNCLTCTSGKCEDCKNRIFVCGCNDEDCIKYRESKDLTYCDMNCSTCISGKCGVCSTEWITSVSKFEADATARVLYMDGEYLILGLAQLASGDGQRGTSTIKVHAKPNADIGVLKMSSSDLNGGVNGNNCYGSLADSEYTIYKDEALTQVVGKVRGNGEDVISVPMGTYWIKETLAPKGYYMDTEPHRVDVTDSKIFKFSDDPMMDPTLIAAQKNVENRDTAGITAGDVGALKGIQFDIYYYKGTYDSLDSLPDVADEHAVFETDEYGLLLFDDKYLAPDETWKYIDETNNLAYPLGTIVVKEKSSIDGLTIYNNYGMMFTVTDMSDKTSNDVTDENYMGTVTTIVGSSNKNTTADRVAGTYENSIIKGGVTVSKTDLDWEKGDFQGDATLAGAEFTIYNRSESSVYYNGNFYEPGDAIMTITSAYDDTSRTYVATTGAKALEYGTYEIKETKAPEGYNLADWSRTFTIREDGQMHFFSQESSADTANGLNWLHRWCADPVMRGGVTIGKVDRETKQYYSLGGSSLAGAKFQIINKSEHPVYVNGMDYAPNEVVMELTAGKMDITIGTGVDTSVKTIIGCTTGNNVLPYGTYDIIETGTGIGYLYDTNSKNQKKTFSVQGEGDMHYFTDEKDAFHNQVQREDWYFQKKADDSGHEMPKIAWTVTSVTTGETHVIVTDENGKYQSDQVPHTQRTNANDPDSPISNGAIAVNEDGEYYVADSSKLDYDAGTWFTGLNPEITKWADDGHSYTVIDGTNTAAVVNDQFRAYPYDTYLVQELSSDANEGYNLVNFLVTLKRYDSDPDSNGIILDYGTVDNQHVDIYTTLGYNADGFAATAKSVPAASEVELIDTITYAGITAGDEYTMKGEVHVMDADGNDEGVIASNEITFEAKASGQLKMPFTVDTFAYAGKTLVVTEEIWQNNVLLTEEKDLTNEDQTVWVAGIKATRAEKIQTSPDAVTIIDHVDYTNLEIGSLYSLTMTLVNQETGDILLDNNGDAITTEVQFVPGTISGTKDMTTTFQPADDMEGITAVVFEELTKGAVYGEHKDLNDKDQTVSFINMIDTYAVNGITHTKELSAKADQSIYECIKLNGLEDGKSYKLEGSVYWIDDEGTARAFLNSEGEAITITIENPQNEEVMTFDGIDATKLGGRDVVVYQTLYERKEDEDWKIAYEHCDNDDADQIVHIPAISGKPSGDVPSDNNPLDGIPEGGTILTTENGIHSAMAGKVTLTDKVGYVNVTPGQKYTLIGTLHIREDAEVEDGYEAVDMGELEGVTASAEFTAEDVNGVADVVFTFDASDLTGKVVVAFEELHTDADHIIPDEWSQFFGDTGIANMSDETDVETGSDAAKTVLLAEHKDIADVNQSVGFTKIKSTTLTADDGLHIASAGEKITLKDVVEYEGVVPGMAYDITGTLNVKDEEKVLKTVKDTFTPATTNGTVDVPFTFDSKGFDGKTVVAFETVSQNGIELSSHKDMNDEGQSVHFAGIDTVLTGVAIDSIKSTDSSNSTPKNITFDVYSGKVDQVNVGQLQAEIVALTDVVTYSNLTTGKEYTIKGEIHRRAKDGSDSGSLFSIQEIKFTPTESNGTVEVKFNVAPVGIEEGVLVAFEYLYDGDKLIASHADISDNDQAVTVKANHVEPYKNPCGCDDPNCKHKDEKNHCINNPGCCDDSDCCKDCKQCKSKNPCGCDDPNCKHKNEKDHCVNNPGCCDDADCCKNCKQCKAKKAPTPIQNVIETIKTGQNTFLSVGIIGLMLMSGGGYLFFAKTLNGRKIWKRFMNLFRK